MMHLFDAWEIPQLITAAVIIGFMVCAAVSLLLIARHK